MDHLDLQTVETYLQHRFHASAVGALSSGTWSQAFVFTVNAHRFVLRFGGDRVEYEKDQLAANWSSQALPVPEVLEVGEAFDRHFAISRHVDGLLLDELDADGWHRTIPALLEALGALRDITLPGVGYGPFNGKGEAAHATWSSWLIANLDGDGEGRISSWRDSLSVVPGAMDRYEAGVERFAEVAAACPELRHATHTDLAGNTLTTDGRMSGIIDWGNAVAGDPLYDIAHLTFWAPWHPGCPEIELRHSAAEVLGDAEFDQRVYAYELHISLAAQRFNAAMGRPHLLDELTDRADRLSPA
ncbi:MAG: phosphotransferase [Lacisediminihabitans sp.]